MNKKNIFFALIGLSLTLVSCSDESGEPGIVINEPAIYSFTRDGVSTVSFSGQSTRIMMAEEVIDALKDNTLSETTIEAMYSHEEGGNDFSDAELNASNKNLRSKTAASSDFFSANTTLSNEIKADFEGWIAGQVDEVFPAWDVEASTGNAGFLQEAGGGPIRYVNASGLEYDQAFGKSLIGALMVDQMLNNYLSTSVLDAGNNIDDNNTQTLVDGKSYTNMEHKWDEAYGYAYGTSQDPANPNATIGSDDSFLNKYIGRVENDPDFAGIADDIFNAFKLGRAAIVAGDYETRDAQAAFIQQKVSEVIAIRAVYYLQQGKAGLEAGTVDYGSAFHDLSEGFGFIYSLQFTRMPGTSSPYFRNDEVESMLEILIGIGSGFWDVNIDALDDISDDIASKFSFTVEQAGS